MKQHMNQVKLEAKLQQRLEEIVEREGFPSNAGFIRFAIVQTLNQFDHSEFMPTFTLTPEQEEAVREGLQEYKEGKAEFFDPNNLDEIFS